MTGSLGNAIAEHVEALCVAKAPALPGEVPTSDRTSVTDDSAYASFRSPKGRYEVQQKAKQAPVSLGGLSVEIPGWRLRHMLQLIMHGLLIEHDPAPRYKGSPIGVTC